MKRAYWKKTFVNVESLLRKDSDLSIKISWNSEIVLNFVGKSFLIHNGKNFMSLQVHQNMVGHKFGEFHFTWKTHRFKKK